MAMTIATLVFRGWSEENDHSESLRDRVLSPPETVPSIDSVEATLAEQVRAGDRHALEAIYLANAAALEQFACTMLGTSDSAHDVVQDVFVWVWERREQFVPRTSIRAYLIGAVRHRALDKLRRTQVRAGGTDAEAARVPTTALSPAERLEHDELCEVVAAAFATLTPRVREVAELRWGALLSYREIAALLGVSERTVNTQLTTAARTLRQRLERYWRER